MNSFLKLAALIAAFTPAIASAGITVGITFGGFSGCSSYLCVLGSNFIYIINSILVPVLFALSFIVFLWGVYYYYIYGGASDEFVKKGHSMVMWGIIGFAVMISVWGLVNVVSNTFGLGGFVAPAAPTSY